MKILFVFGTTALLLAGSLTGTLLAEQSEEAPKVDPKAREIIGRAVDYLANAKQFRVTAEIWQDLEVDPGEMLSSARWWKSSFAGRTGCGST